ncbi:glucan endo-1,3-beta-glucosidase, acidic isoform-like [Miscanthus floridulus]|uniref:glucan endo-1,3-beta-glucosidase, acidic isoform-like n=1 Tax=Miscanthus floridulus TaxID=154761 RepID=UPI00345A3A47
MAPPSPRSLRASRGGLDVPMVHGLDDKSQIRCRHRHCHAFGVCYGVNGDNLSSASDVVQLYQSNGINQMRIYFPDTNALNALSDSNIRVIMDVPNSDLSSLASDTSTAATWVQSNVQVFPWVNFKYIAVGNEVSGGDTNSIHPAMQNVNSALANAGLGNIGHR